MARNVLLLPPQLPSQPFTSDPSRPSNPSLGSPRLASCHGIRIRWSAGEFDENYPFHKHSGKARKRLGYDIVSLSPPRARSYKCRGTILSHEDACPECRSAQVDVDIFNHQAQRPWRRVIPYTNLSYAQQRSRARALQKQLDSKVLEISSQRIWPGQPPLLTVTPPKRRNAWLRCPPSRTIGRTSRHFRHHTSLLLPVARIPALITTSNTRPIA
ncbi:hypothetical protein EV121DRAFT_297825 [Schizophyllum commune]